MRWIVSPKRGGNLVGISFRVSGKYSFQSQSRQNLAWSLQEGKEVSIRSMHIWGVV